MAKTLRSPAHHLLLRALRSARKAANLNQQDVAARLGKPQSYIAKIETGERRIDVVELIAIAKVIELDLQVLLTELAAHLDEQSDRSAGESA